MAEESGKSLDLVGELARLMFGMSYLLEELTTKVLVIEAKVLNPHLGPEELTPLVEKALGGVRERVTGRQMAKMAYYEDGPN